VAVSPLSQFEIKPIVPIEVAGIDASFTNASLFMALAVAVATLFITLGMRRGALVPGRWQSMVEASYEFVAGMVRENCGKEGRPYFPFVFSLFMFILLGNMLGMIPYGFTFTSHIIVTFAMALLVFVGVTIVGLVLHGAHFFSLFFPTGAPVAMAPILVPIEIISYLTRPISLSVRLFANMVAGHTMLKVFAAFTISVGAFTWGIGGLAPLAINVALVGFEILVAFLQAYVFTILTCLYLHDAIHLH
jgi:F-type H+-transporting ATPase subunit a